MYDGFNESLRMALLNRPNGVGVRGGESHSQARLREINNG